MIGKGIQKVNKPKGIKGNQHVVFKITIPSASSLSQDQKKLIEEFGRLNGSFNTTKESKKPFDFFKSTIDKLKGNRCDGDKKPNGENEKTDKA